MFKFEAMYGYLLNKYESFRLPCIVFVRFVNIVTLSIFFSFVIWCFQSYLFSFLNFVFYYVKLGLLMINLYERYGVDSFIY